MCIYCNTSNYRKIYENHNGPLLKESNGRSYEVHHIDGNHSNNSPENLKLVTIQEHYDIHNSQGDLGACLMIGRKMRITPEELTELNRQSQLKRVKDGTHHLLGGKIQSIASQKKAKEGTLGFQNPETFSKACAARDKKINEMVSAGTWILQNPVFHQLHVANQIKNGKHCSQIKKKCEHCDKIVDSANYARSHGNNCSKVIGVKKISKHPPREQKTCCVCGKVIDASNFIRHNHGVNCKKLTKV